MRGCEPQATHNVGAVLMAHASECNSIWSVIVPADGTRAATVWNGDFGTSPIFGQLSDKPLLASIRLCGVSDVKSNGGSRKLRAIPIR
jgi:hypothetical protein